MGEGEPADGEFAARAKSFPDRVGALPSPVGRERARVRVRLIHFQLRFLKTGRLVVRPGK